MGGNEKRHYSPLMVQNPIGEGYDSVEFNLSTGVTDYDVKVNETAAFLNLKYYTTINVRSNKEITMKLNSSTNSSITIDRNRPYELDNLIKIINIFLTNASGETAAIKIIGVQKGV